MSEKNLTKPDLNEDSNVLESHRKLLEASAASKRENTLQENGLEAITLPILFICAIVLLIAGAVIGTGGFPNYGSTIKNGYLREVPPGFTGEQDTTAPIKDILVKKGGKIYQAKCQGCHQPTGMGDGANYPPLGGSEWVAGDTKSLAAIILYGVKGPIKVAGKTWNGNMPAQAQGMTSTDLAAVMTYIRNSFGNEAGDVVSLEMADNALNDYKEKSRASGGIAPQVTTDVLGADYKGNLEGEQIDPTTVVDKDTLQPTAG